MTLADILNRSTKRAFDLPEPEPVPAQPLAGDMNQELGRSPLEDESAPDIHNLKNKAAGMQLQGIPAADIHKELNLAHNLSPMRATTKIAAAINVDTMFVKEAAALPEPMSLGGVLQQGRKIASTITDVNLNTRFNDNNLMNEREAGQRLPAYYNLNPSYTGTISKPITRAQVVGSRTQGTTPAFTDNIKLQRTMGSNWQNSIAPMTKATNTSNQSNLDFNQSLNKRISELKNVKQASEIPTTQEHIRHAIRKAENVCDCNPTEAQKKAGNYKMGHVTIQGLPITIENPAGSVRCGVAKDGKEWSTKMKHSYGYFGNTVGKDSDHVDVFLGDHPLSHMVYIVDQKDPATDKFDEHKVMFGFHTKQEAKDAYFANYQADWKGFMDIKSMPIGEFKKWVRTGKKTEEAVKQGSDVSIKQAAGLLEGMNGIKGLFAKYLKAQNPGGVLKPLLEASRTANPEQAAVSNSDLLRRSILPKSDFKFNRGMTTFFDRPYDGQFTMGREGKEYTNAAYFPSLKSIIYSMTPDALKGLNRAAPSVGGTIGHEYGHAIDDAINTLSPEVKNALRGRLSDKYTGLSSILSKKELTAVDDYDVTNASHMDMIKNHFSKQDDYIHHIDDKISTIKSFYKSLQAQYGGSKPYTGSLPMETTDGILHSIHAAKAGVYGGSRYTLPEMLSNLIKVRKSLPVDASSLGDKSERIADAFGKDFNTWATTTPDVSDKYNYYQQIINNQILKRQLRPPKELVGPYPELKKNIKAASDTDTGTNPQVSSVGTKSPAMGATGAKDFGSAPQITPFSNKTNSTLSAMPKDESWKSNTPTLAPAGKSDGMANMDKAIEANARKGETIMFDKSAPAQTAVRGRQDADPATMAAKRKLQARSDAIRQDTQGSEAVGRTYMENYANDAINNTGGRMLAAAGKGSVAAVQSIAGMPNGIIRATGMSGVADSKYNPLSYLDKGMAESTARYNNNMPALNTATDVNTGKSLKGNNMFDNAYSGNIGEAVTQGLEGAAYIAPQAAVGIRSAKALGDSPLVTQAGSAIARRAGATRTAGYLEKAGERLGQASTANDINETYVQPIAGAVVNKIKPVNDINNTVGGFIPESVKHGIETGSDWLSKATTHRGSSFVNKRIEDTKHGLNTVAANI